MKLNNKSVPSRNWVSKKSDNTMSCDITAADDTFSTAPVWLQGSNTVTATTTTGNTATTLKVQSTVDAMYTCRFTFADKTTVDKTFSLVIKGCKKPSITDGSYTPTTTDTKITPGTELTFSCSNST